MQGMRVLVTGGLGFIGSHTVVELINQGHEPVIADALFNSDRSVLERLKEITGADVPFYEIDVCDYDAVASIFKSKEIDGVIHFAALKAPGESVQQPLRYYHNNLDSLVTVLEAMQDNGVGNFIFSSSCTVYGNAKKQPVSEKTPLQEAASPYGYTKQVGEVIIRDTAKANPLKAIALRYFNPTGAHPSGLIGELPTGVPNNLVPFITQTVAGIRDELTVFGDDYDTPDGSNVRDYIHVVDLARAHIKALDYLIKQDAHYYDVFNVGTGRGTSVLEAIKIFETVNKVKVNYRIGPRREGDVITAYADPTKIEQTLGWKAELTVEDAMRDAWNWQQHL
jgi:UDP-glucose 4-epimerase